MPFLSKINGLVVENLRFLQALYGVFEKKALALIKGGFAHLHKGLLRRRLLYTEV